VCLPVTNDGDRFCVPSDDGYKHSKFEAFYLSAFSSRSLAAMNAGNAA
jgi:hypothetical protein